MKNDNCRFKLFYGLLFMVLLEGCAGEIGSWRDNQIAGSKRSEFHAMNDTLLQNLKAKKMWRLKLLLSREMNTNNRTERMVDIAGNYLSDYKYEMVNEYYVYNRFNDIDSVINNGSGINKYDLIYPGVTQEMYIALFLPKTNRDKYLLTLVYAKFNYGWKLNQMELSPYTINGKTAPELFKQAKEEYAENYLINAVNNMQLVATCLHPAEIWHYKAEEEMHGFYSKLVMDVNNHFKFPVTVSNMVTKPRILKVYNKTTDEGTFPMVYYLSAIKLADTIAIKNENMALRKVIGKVIPGINKNNKQVMYSVFNQVPTGRAAVDHFDMTDKLK